MEYSKGFHDNRLLERMGALASEWKGLGGADKLKFKTVRESAVILREERPSFKRDTSTEQMKIPLRKADEGVRATPDMVD